MPILSSKLPPNVIHVKAPTRNVTMDNDAIEQKVKEIISNVRERGDAALHHFSEIFDNVSIDQFEVSLAQREAAVKSLSPQTRQDTDFAIANVQRFAQAQLATMHNLEVENIPGVHLGHRIIPIQRIGAYVPSGRYPLLSAPVMTIVPARVAGCEEVIACLPPGAHESVIAVCHLSGATRIFRVGGAQAIAALAYGTDSIPAVDKIVGPGNIFVNEAKKQVFGPVGIDQLAGPSEIYILADDSADPLMVAIDLLAQAEHDIHTRVGLITTSRPLAEAVEIHIQQQLETLETANIAGQAWRNYGEIALCESEESMIAYSDIIAAEHLQIHTKKPHEMALKLRNYGSLFIGPQASVVYSDKCSGTNHTLPTMGAGRYTGGLWAGTFVKVCTHQWMEDEGVNLVAPPAMRQSASEGLEGHKRAAAIRLSLK